MRQVTLNRRKAFPGCLSTMSVYIEDAAREELRIGGKPCRKLGELKNGTQQTFAIDTNEATLFVAPGKSTKERYLEQVHVPAGDEDLVLNGQCYLNLLGGNMFCFDQNNSDRAKKARTRNTVLGVLLMVAVAAVSGFIPYTVTSAVLSASSSSSVAAEKLFTANGMTITLTEDFEETPIETHTAAFVSKHVTVIALQEPFYLADGIEELSLEDYARLVMENSGLTCELQQNGEQLFFEYDYTLPDTDLVYRYYAFVYKAPDAFWTVNFATKSEHADEHVDEIQAYASSVLFI